MNVNEILSCCAGSSEWESLFRLFTARRLANAQPASLALRGRRQTFFYRHSSVPHKSLRNDDNCLTVIMSLAYQLLSKRGGKTKASVGLKYEDTAPGNSSLLSAEAESADNTHNCFFFLIMHSWGWIEVHMFCNLQTGLLPILLPVLSLSPLSPIFEFCIAQIPVKST